MQPNEYDTMFRVEETHWWYRALHRLVFEALDRHLPDWRERKILDAGCGTGAILQRLGNPARNVGVDLAPEAIAFCRRRGLTNVEQADVAALPFGDGSFDAVISSSVLYHTWVKDLDAVAHEMHRVLRPAGLLFVVLPAFSFLHSAHDVAVMTGHRFTKGEVRTLLRRNGFRLGQLTYWTTLLFPLALIARTLGGSTSGRDFERAGLSNRIFDRIMSIEAMLLRKFSFPFGVALFAVARKSS